MYIYHTNNFEQDIVSSFINRTAPWANLAYFEGKLIPSSALHGVRFTLKYDISLGKILYPSTRWTDNVSDYRLMFLSISVYV